MRWEGHVARMGEKNANETSATIKREEFHDQLNDYQLLKKDSAV